MPTCVLGSPLHGLVLLVKCRLIPTFLRRLCRLNGVLGSLVLRPGWVLVLVLQGVFVSILSQSCLVQLGLLNSGLRHSKTAGIVSSFFKCYTKYQGYMPLLCPGSRILFRLIVT
jgi:hypothetical protein